MFITLQEFSWTNRSLCCFGHDRHQNGNSVLGHGMSTRNVVATTVITTTVLSNRRFISKHDVKKPEKETKDNTTTCACGHRHTRVHGCIRAAWHRDDDVLGRSQLSVPVGRPKCWSLSVGGAPRRLGHTRPDDTTSDRSLSPRRQCTFHIGHCHFTRRYTGANRPLNRRGTRVRVGTRRTRSGRCGDAAKTSLTNRANYRTECQV